MEAIYSHRSLLTVDVKNSMVLISMLWSMPGPQFQDSS